MLKGELRAMVMLIQSKSEYYSNQGGICAPTYPLRDVIWVD